MRQEVSGRTMVEMLGVLAIIGILSIGGIMGFRYAMNKHYANETVERLTKRAVVIASQRLNGTNANLDDFDENDGMYPISHTVEIKDAESFNLSVNNVPQEICSLIKTLDWTMAKMIPEDCSDTALKFKFLNDLSDCSDCVPDGVDCSQYGTECGQCSVVKGFTPNDDDCANSENGGHCVRGKCEKCADGYYERDKVCYACQSSASTYFNSASTKHNCLGSMFYSSAYNWMVGCEDSSMTSKGDADEVSCKACSDWCFNPNNSICYHYNAGQMGLVRNADGTCSDCVTGFYWRDNKCNACNKNIDTYYISESDKHNCLGSMYFSNPYGWFIGCEDSIERSGADELSCVRCTNRCFDAANNNTCRLLGNTYDRDANGYCVPK